jgi:hypothetical protein
MRPAALLSSLLTVGACGKVQTLVDGSNSIDSATVDANAHGIVKVTVLDPQGTGAPAAGIPVVFVNPSGELVARMSTDTNGHAQADVLQGANVTAVWQPNPGDYQLQTVFEVKPGDDITLGQVNQSSTDAGKFTVNFTPTGGVGDYFYVYGPCGSSQGVNGTATLYMMTNCQQPVMDLTVYAYNSLGTSLGYVEKANVAFVNGGSATMPSTWQSFINFSAQYSNITTRVTSINMNRYAPDSQQYSSGDGNTVSGTTLSLTTTGPATATAQIESRMSDANGSQQQIRQKINGNATTYGLDVGGKLLGWLSAPILHVDTGVLEIPVDTAGTSGDAPDVFIAQTRFSHPTIDAGTATNVLWIVFAPRPGNITLPKMPVEVGPVNPQAGDTTSNFDLAAMADSDAIDGYDAIRNNLYAAFNGAFDDRAPATTVRISNSPFNFK